MKKISNITFLFLTAFLTFPLYAADIHYCSGSEKPFDAKNQALQDVLKQISTDSCVIGNNCISTTASYTYESSYTLPLEENKDKNKVQCSWGTSITVRCKDGVAKPGERRTGFCRVVSGAGGPDIRKSYNSPPL